MKVAFFNFKKLSFKIFIRKKINVKQILIFENPSFHPLLLLPRITSSTWSISSRKKEKNVFTTSRLWKRPLGQTFKANDLQVKMLTRKSEQRSCQLSTTRFVT